MSYQDMSLIDFLQKELNISLSIGEIQTIEMFLEEKYQQDKPIYDIEAFGD